MGKCDSCEKETKNSYTFRTATITGKNTIREGNVLQSTITTTTHYQNVVSHSTYICTKCAWKAWVFNNRFAGKNRGAYVFFGAIVIFISIAYLISGKTETGLMSVPIFNIAALALGGLSVLFVIYIFVSSFADLRLPQRYGAEAVASISEYGDGILFFLK